MNKQFDWGEEGEVTLLGGGAGVAAVVSTGFSVSGAAATLGGESGTATLLEAAICFASMEAFSEVRVDTRRVSESGISVHRIFSIE